MAQNYTIFIKNHPLNIRFDEQAKHTYWLQSSFNASEYSSLDNLKDALHTYVNQLITDKLTYLDVLTGDTNSVLEVLKQCFDKEIVAAGGAVFNDKNQVLCIFRRGFWDLPKGKVEEQLGESIAEAAIREVKEETGLVNIVLGHSLPSTYHVYELNSKAIFKTTHWFLMMSNDQQLIPQTEEDIVKAEWVAASSMDEVFNNMYENIKLVVTNALQLKGI